MEENVDVEIHEDLKPIEKQTIDTTPYIGKKVKIEEVTQHITDRYAKSNNGKKSYYVKVSTEIVDTIGEGDNKVELRGSRIFGVQQDKNNQLGWTPDSKLSNFLKSMGVSELDKLKGEVVILTLTDVNSNGQRFLTF